MDIQFIVGVITIIASMYGMLKFMLKDTHKELEIAQKNQVSFEAELKEQREVSNRINMRLDGLYKILLDKVYGNK